MLSTGILFMRVGNSILRARSCTRRPALKSRREGRKEEPDNEIAVAECASVEPFFILCHYRRISIRMCGVSIFS